MMKRILSLLLVLLMVVSMLPTHAFAAGENDAAAEATEQITQVCETCGNDPCTCEGDGQEETENYDSHKGKYVKLNEAVSIYTVGSAAGSGFSYYPEDFTEDTILRIADWKVVGDVLWYLVEFYRGSIVESSFTADFPAEPWFQQTVDSSTNALVFLDTCETCGKPDCETEHIKCDICGKYECKAVHFWCETCEKYDCGIAHVYCGVCKTVDCGKTHTWCGICGDFDCGIQHEDLYKPDATPVIPENPTMTPGADVSIVDENGDAVTEDGLRLVEGMKSSISAWPDGGADSYRWQVRYNNANDLWTDIQGETGKGILVSPAMFLALIDYQGTTAIRCVATSGAETKVSAAIPVIVEEAVPAERASMLAESPRSGSSGDAAPMAESDGGVKYSIIIEFKFPNGDTAAQAWTASLSAGADYVLDVECPDVVGYKPDRERITETITAISGNMTYTVTYTPDYVDYKVVHHQQNIGDNNYTAVKTETKTGLTGSPVGTGLETEYDGFYDLIYDPEIAVAADGSTVINIYYDRYYYLVSLDLNGGHGVEPIYARYGTYINSAAWVPQRTGYAFSGWSPALPAAVPLNGSSHTAQWAKANTGFTVAFWYENANDEDYTFVGSVPQTAVTGTKVNGAAYKDVAFAGRDDDHFTYEKADTNVEIAADGSTVVNVYFTRNSYTLTYYKWKCLHSHTNACCSLQHTSHSDSCCSIPYHVNHTTGCITNDLKRNTTYIPEGDLDDAVPNRYNGVCIAYRYLGATRYYVWFDGSWYRTANGNNGKDAINWNCMGQGHNYTHDHTSGCTCTQYHDHSSGKLSNCNSSACTHSAYYGCETDISNMNHWTVFYQGTFKYEQDVSAIHAAQGAERWCPGACEGLKRDDGTYYPSYGQSPAHGVYSSMGGGDVVFFQGGTGANAYKLTFWLETYDGSGSRNYNGKNFAQGTTFTAKMGAVGYWGDYDAGCPAGFDVYEAWTSDSLAGSNGTQLKVDDTFGGSTYLYYNFYYIRKNFDLTYFNGSNVVATRSMKYDEPLTSAYNLQNLSMTSPYGSGYYFAGWYLDADCTVPVSWGNTRMADGGLAVYAKWAPLTHTVTTYQTKGGTMLGTYTTVHGTTVENAPEDPTRDGYNFVSWFYEEDGIEKAYNFSMPVNKDLELYAVWTSDSLASGTISYMIEGTTTKIAADTPISGLVGASKTYNSKIGTELNTGYQAGYFPATSSHNIVFSTTTSQNNWIFYYKKMDDVPYTVRYINKDTGAALMAETTGTSNAGKITITHKPYTGYAADAYSKDLVLSSDPDLNVVTFYYTKDDVHAPVQVEHYIQNTAGTGYALYFSEQPYNGTIGQTQNATPLNLTGFTHNSGISINGVKLTASGLVLKLYYDRNTYNYTFRFMIEGTDTELRTAVTGSGLYGAQVSQVAPAIPGYDLTSSGSLTVTIGTDDSTNVRTFYYEEDEVTIRYQVGSVKGGAVSRDSETVLAVTGNPKGSTATANTDYVFKGWYTNYACTGTAVSTDMAFKPSKVDGVYEAKTYYAKFEEEKVAINYKIDGPAGSADLSSTTEQVSVLTGKATGSTVTAADKYDFAGWFDSNGNKVSDSKTFAPTKSGDKWVDGTTYTAKIVEKEATINYVAVGGGTVSPETEKVDMLTGSASGTTAEAMANISTFVGWYDNAACEGAALSTNAAFTPTLPTGGWNEAQTYYAKFENTLYTITFEDRGSVVKTQEYVYGDHLTLPEVTNGNYLVTWTVKDNSGDWEQGTEVNDGVINHYGNVTLVANWTIDVYWIDWDFRIPTSAEEDILEKDLDVAYGEDHTYDGKMPTRDATDQYTYTFKEWVEEDLSAYGNPEGLIVYRAAYEETVNKYTVKGTIDNEGTVTNPDQTVEYGKDSKVMIFTPAEGYKITSVTVNGEPRYTFPEDSYSFCEKIYEDTTVVVTTERNYFTITFLNAKGEVLSEEEYVYGTKAEEIVKPADPQKESTAEFSYTFAGWEPEIADVTEDATYRPTYTAHTRSYTITWVDGDGNTLKTETLAYNAVPQYSGATPTKKATAQYTYTWNNTWSPAITAVTGPATYTAQFDATVNKYPITWVDGDGKTLKTEQVEYGKTPAYTGATPTKKATAQYTYTFNNTWSPAISAVTGAATYTAQFDSVVNKYTITWIDGDGKTLKTEKLPYGDIPVYSGATPTKAATPQYTYTWDNTWSPAVVTVTKDATYTAQFTASARTYTVTWKNWNGDVLKTDTVDYNAKLTYSGIEPSREKDPQYWYNFEGWNGSDGSQINAKEEITVTGDITYTAILNPKLRDYTVTWKVDGVTKDEGSWEYGQTPTYNGETPTKAEDKGYTYQWTGEWTPVVVPVVDNVTYEAVFEKTVKTFSITYTLNDGQLPAGVTNPESYNVETDTFKLNNPERTGYEFTGWTGSFGSEPQTEVFIYKGTTGNLTFTANWSAKDVAYQVVHWQQKIGGGSEHNDTNFQQKETENLTAKADSKVTPEVKSYEGFTAPAKVEVNIAADGSTVVNYYYTRNTYTINFHANEGDGTMESLTLAYNQSAKLPANAFTRKGYSFLGWATTATGAVAYADQEDVENLTVEDGKAIDLYAVWEINLFNLIIKTNNTVDANQSYIFTVIGEAVDGTQINLQVAMGANDEQKIVGVPAGTYTVADQQGWSWRYDHQTQTQNVYNDVVVDFSYTYTKMIDTKIYWLNGYGNEQIRKKEENT